jgi:CheY-like chemotaxis protein
VNVPPGQGEINGAPLGKSADISVLLVEDHEPTRAVLTRLLVRRNYRVKAAGSATEARSLAASESFQLLISDVGLPDGNGFELMREFGTRYNMRGIALTGYGTENDLEKSQAAGFAVHLIKPVHIQALEAALAKVLTAS